MEQQIGIGQFKQRVVAAGLDDAGRIDNFDYGIQRPGRAIDVEPNLGAGGRVETVHVDIRFVLQQAADFESEPQVVVAAGLIGSQFAQELRAVRCVVVATGRSAGRLALEHHFDVAVVAILIQPHATPVARPRDALNAVVVGIVLQFAGRCLAGAHRVVLQRRKHDGEVGLAHNMQDAADPVVDLERPPGNGNSRTDRGIEIVARTGELDDKLVGGTALQTQAAVGVKVGHDNLIEQDVNDVRIVPGALGRQRFTTNDNGVQRVVEHNVFANQRTLVLKVAFTIFDQSGSTPRIGLQCLIQRVGVDGQRRCRVVANLVIQNHRLGAEDIDRGR